MNKKLVAFLLSTGILVSTCGTAFANEVFVNDIPNNTVNAVNPNYINNLITQINKSIDELNKIANELSQIPVANEDAIAKLGEMTDKYIEQLNKATTKADIDLIIDDFNKTTKEFVAISGMTNPNLTRLNDLYREAEVQYKNIHDLLDKLVTVNGSGTAVLELSQQVIELSKSINEIYDTKNSESNKHINNITNELSKCQEKIKKISASITLDGMQNTVIDNNATNSPNNNVTNLPNNNVANPPTNNLDKKPTDDKKDEDKPPVDFSNEYIDDDEKFEELTGGMNEKRQEAINKIKEMGDNLNSKPMKEEMDKAIADCKDKLEAILKGVKTTSETDTNTKIRLLDEEYNDKLNDIKDKYTKKEMDIFDEIDKAILDVNLTTNDIEGIYDVMDKYERELRDNKIIADGELVKLFDEYQKLISKAYEKQNTTSTYTSRSGNSSSGLSDDYDFGGSSSRTSRVNSTGLSSPKTGDYTTLGASIATMIAGIAGIFVSRKR